MFFMHFFGGPKMFKILPGHNVKPNKTKDLLSSET